MISMALAKNVQTNGSERVTNSPLNVRRTKKAITERKNNTQYKPVDFFAVSIDS